MLVEVIISSVSCVLINLPMYQGLKQIFLNLKPIFVTVFMKLSTYVLHTKSSTLKVIQYLVVVPILNKKMAQPRPLFVNFCSFKTFYK